MAGTETSACDACPYAVPRQAPSRTRLTLALCLSLAAAGDPTRPGLPAGPSHVPDWPTPIPWQDLVRPIAPSSFQDTLPESWHAVRHVPASGETVTGPGGSLLLSTRVGMAPMPLDITWTVHTAPQDRALRLSLVDDDGQPLAMSERSLGGPPRLETVRARWEVSQAGAYAVVGCVVPRMACTVARLVVS
jgi:hypothetical protein